MSEPRFSPRDFLRARRPERFSDSVAQDLPVLDRSMLEYQLDTVTSRNQEQDFEHFARHLAEKEICPNLLPHTGPTGGGDSKVDSETYPVADSLSHAWFSGIGREAATERWAFAFSAKAKWQDKLKSDIAKISATKRGYTRAFFITNQFVPDRVRSKVEDSLSKKHKLDVRVLDRTWILDRVFAGGHQELAINDLGLSTSRVSHIRKGPRDVEREQDLSELEQRVTDAIRENRFDFALVEASLETALLARGLERPRTEIDGRFDRAARLAEQYGTRQQQLDCAYEHAWTTFWWFEDYASFTRLHTSVEEYAKESDNPYDLERLSNLWFVLKASVGRGAIEAAGAELEQRTKTLLAALERLSKEEERPSAALQAEALLVKARLMADPSRVNVALTDLEGIVRRSEGLVGFPLEPLAEILTEMGNVFGDVPEYEGLYETLVDVTTRRSGEVHAAKMLLKRGAQQLDANRPYDAIRALGRAMRALYKHESRRELIQALYLCGAAYEEVGLLWAARGTLLMAAWIATSEFSTYGAITTLQAACYRRLKWVELRLGRVPQALEWYELDRTVRDLLVAQGHDRDELFSDEMAFDAGLGVLFLNASVSALQTLTDVPDVLERLGLFRSSLALRFALGHEEEARKELDKVVPEDELMMFFSQWRNQPIARDLPQSPSPSEERRTQLVSRVLGCAIEVSTDYAFPALELSESLLAATESFLSTGFEHRLIAREPLVQIEVRRSDFAEGPFEFTAGDRRGVPFFEVRCRAFANSDVNRELQGALKKRLLGLVAEVIDRAVFVADPDKSLQALFEEERVLERALDFTSSFVVTTNILGPAPRNRLSSWAMAGDQRYPLLRTTEWHAVEETSSRGDISPQGTITLGQGEPPAEVGDMSRTRHDKVRTVSVIREALWNKARWSATGFIVDLSNQLPPIMALIFKDQAAAREIFDNWQAELGPVDTEERLRVSIVRGINKAKPLAYRVVVAPSLEALKVGENELGVYVGRIHVMEPETPENLDRFLRSYSALGEYLIAPGVMETDGQPGIMSRLALSKRQLFVREAWQIGRNDPDVMGVSQDDDPLIPSDVDNAPVSELLNWVRARSQGTS